MSSPIWLMCCAADGAEPLRDEIFLREPGAQLLRFEDPEAVDRMVRASDDLLAGIAVRVAGPVDGVREALAGAKAAHVPVLAFVDHLDAGDAARLFHAGATEVIAAGGASSAARESQACTGKGDLCRVPSPADDEASAEAPPWDECVSAAAPCAEREPSVKDAGGAMPPSADTESGAPGRVSTDASADAAKGRFPAGATAAGSRVSDTAEASDDRRPAPLVVAISGRGGCGKSTITVAMAWWAAHMGLKAAVVDLDLMFGNLYELMGVERVCDLAGLVAADGTPACTRPAIEATAMRIAPGLTLWGPCTAPEQAELLSVPSEQLIEVLRREADVIFADTSVFWGDAAASAVSRCDRCLVVGTGGVSDGESAARAVALAARIGVPKTRMTCVFNRFGAPGCDEERALRFEMAVALRSRMRIADGGSYVSDLLAYGRIGDLLVTPGAFSRDIQARTYELLKELGCPLEAWDERHRVAGAIDQRRSRIRLPWKREEVGER